MKAIQIITGFCIVASLTACGGGQQSAPTGEEMTGPESTSCTYTYTEGSIAAQWTAYKTTERVGVSGTFDTIRVEGVQAAGSANEAFAGAGFSIPVSSINSSNPDRDRKIMESFFGTMTQTDVLSGKVLSISDSDCSVLINMNGVADTCLFNLTQNDTMVSLSGVLELANWSALKSVDALNKVCFDLHKGADGVSKLWPDVKLEITAGITKVCDQ